MSGTLKDFQKIHAGLPPRGQWVCRTCLALCLRPGKELVTLTRDAFDWQGRYVTVHMPKVDRDKIVYPPEAYLAEAWDRCQSAEQPFVCLSAHGKQLSCGSFKNLRMRTGEKSDILFPPYAMRHIAASQMLYSGADIAAVAAQPGHASVATAASTYVHAIASGQKKAALGPPVLPLVRNGAGSDTNNRL